MSEFWYSIEGKGAPKIFAVYRWDIWPEGSALAGQNRKRFLDFFETEEEARGFYPYAEEGVQRRDAGNTFAHLPGEDDPVPGGMYPDDY